MYQYLLLYYWLVMVWNALRDPDFLPFVLHLSLKFGTGNMHNGRYYSTDTIICRYHAGLTNFNEFVQAQVHYWMLIDNSGTEPNLIAEGRSLEA